MSRPVDPRRELYQIAYDLSPKQVHNLTSKLLDQLDRCVDDDARRLLLGKGE